ncbi:hypothetical protein C5Y97_18320 [Blastopirellula marina]|uniref:Uncharacterized protein n=2 Tax=Blastopirellula marina TaxID=124 RepID=A0A2S8FLQ7_9BACT|nr:hypothetical protein C5Y98_18310 [Blastopirellula marina]PTL43254.1 hypothetical protein C5Y97_18320 [Blastopirellula marina]
MLAWGGGISIPVPNFKDTSTPFMCQDHACSCRNARNCWTHCCCFSRAEKLAWAAQHKVEPPKYFREADHHQHDTSSEFCGQPQASPDHHACEHEHHATQPKPLLAANCHGESACCHAKPCQTNHSAPPQPVSLANDLRCHALASITLIYSPVLEFDLGQGKLVRLVSQPLTIASSLRPDSFRAAPDPPPPRA